MPEGLDFNQGSLHTRIAPPNFYDADTSDLPNNPMDSLTFSIVHPEFGQQLPRTSTNRGGIPPKGQISMKI
jgi:hypothetical protein